MDKQLSTSNSNVFHLGLCMAGSISAGAYIAGVIDYLIEALEAWEEQKKKDDPTVPNHQVMIDLMGGSSGGGITSAITYFALRDTLQHAFLASDGRTVTIDPDRNVLWKTWVDLNGKTDQEFLQQLLSNSDIGNKYVSSGLNTSFIEEVVEDVKSYITRLGNENRNHLPAYVYPQAELFINLFNITGIKYQLYTKANAPLNEQSFFSEHRDIAHFRWYPVYEKDGRIPLDFSQLGANLPIMLGAAKATSAFPVGLKAVHMRRPARYILDHPFFSFGTKKKFRIQLGQDIVDGNGIYTSLHSDGGVANNEPVELSRDLLYMIQERARLMSSREGEFAKMNEAAQAIAKTHLYNTSVILIDPFPASDFSIEKPGPKANHLTEWAGGIIGAMNSQLLFDAKQAMDAYDKDNYGLAIIAPSKRNTKPAQAIACGSLAGFGGFLSKEFRIHDFFLGRHNCQSFLRKYYVVNLLEEEGSHNYNCVEAVINGYRNQPSALAKHGFRTVENNKEYHWVPIIPDVRMQGRMQEKDSLTLLDNDPLPIYELNPLASNFLDDFEHSIEDRIYDVATNLFDRGWQLDLYVKIGALLGRNGMASEIIRQIKKDFTERGLMQEK